MTLERRRRLISMAAALGLGLGLRLWFVLHAPSVTGDAQLYGDIAKNWLTYGIYGFGQGGAAPHPTLLRLPGYPAFLALCFRVFGMEHYGAVRFVQVAADLGTCVLAARIARGVAGERAGLAALWLAALCPFTANYTAVALSETLSLMCVALAFYGLERWQREGGGVTWPVLAIGAGLSFAVLLRPEQGLLAGVVLPAMLWVSSSAQGRPRVRSLLPMGLAAMCLAVPLTAWTARNWHTFHVFQPLAPRYAIDPGETAPLGFQRWYRTWAVDFESTENVYWNYDSDVIRPEDLPARAFDSESQRKATMALLEEYNETSSATPELDARFDALAQERNRVHAFRGHIGMPMARLANMLLRPRTELTSLPVAWWRWREHRGQSVLEAAYAALDLAYLVAGTLGLWRWRRRSWIGQGGHSRVPLAAAMAGFVVLRCALLLTLDNSEPRYTLELFPILCVWAAILWAEQASGARSTSSYPS